MQLEDLLTKVGQAIEAGMLRDDLKYLASRNRASLQFVKDCNEHAELVEEIEMSDLINQPIGVQIGYIQKFTTFTDDATLAGEIPCSVTTIKAWKSGKAKSPTVGYRQAIARLARLAYNIWQGEKQVSALSPDKKAEIDQRYSSYQTAGCTNQCSAGSDCNNAYSTPGGQMQIELGVGGPVSREVYADPGYARVIPTPGIH
jgi:hypothetical protein